MALTDRVDARLIYFAGCAIGAISGARQRALERVFVAGSGWVGDGRNVHAWAASADNAVGETDAHPSGSLLYGGVVVGHEHFLPDERMGGALRFWWADLVRRAPL